ncbi:hypothetical protein GWI33_001206 [Rhynchophorus ferrugineus]|uniref:Uncharacterized protein n=1 Tax=Rhynchophorus ferrugineus TaxID=354439 RepID=A0A834IQH6_RHYFE|nr:hypothetical protein GWI33_001206 [Rhynchophorus ferrugineus]
MSSDTKDKSVSTKRETNWLRVLFLIQTNICGIIALFYLLKFGCMWKTFFYTILLVFLGVIGKTAGAHRLWAHRCYTASTGLKVFLMLCQTSVGNGTIYEWVRWHRLHHTFFRTELDPYNPSKGFLYSHFLGSLADLSPAQEQALKEIDLSDLENDNVVMFQKKWFYLLYALFTLLLPINAPGEYWGENMVTSFIIIGFFKYFLVLNLTWLIHSATHIWNLKSGEKYPMDSNLVFIIVKTYWLSYHYLTPWDYQIGEFGKYGNDMVSAFIRVCAALELANDLKTVDSATVRRALVKSVKEDKNITECLLEESEEVTLPSNHYLDPKKLY